MTTPRTQRGGGPRRPPLKPTAPADGPPSAEHPDLRPPAGWVAAVGALLLACAGLALHLGRAQLLLTHGTGQGGPCLPGSGCAEVLASPAATLSGVPLVVWALPVHIVSLLLLRGAMAPGERGPRARGGLLVLAMGLALGSLLAVLLAGVSCLPCLALAGAHLALPALVLLPPGGRRPAMPLVDDWLPAMMVGLTAIMGLGSGARLVGFHLDQDAKAAEAEPALTLPPDAAVATALRETEPVEVPAPRSPVPIDDQDPSIGPLTAAVTVVAFLDLQDEASRRLAWALAELEPRYEDRVRFVTKHLPMDSTCNEKRRRTTHPRACAVAVALQCAHLQGGFRGYRRQLLRNPHAVADADLDAYAGELGLDPAAFAACRAGEEGLEAVQADVDQAGKGTLVEPPWLFVEGRVLGADATAARIEATIAVALGERQVDPQGRAPALLDAVVQAGEPLGPAAMVPVEGGFIDAVEAGVDSTGAAVAVAGGSPWPTDLDGARAACAQAGKRLCRRAEWVAACQGAPAVDQDGDGDAFGDRREGRLQPYADPYRSGWCHDQGEVGPTGASPACRTPQGALDLAGNAAEWVEEGLLLGGAAGQGEAVGCHAATQPAGPGWRSASTGFRCCADAAVAPAGGAPLPPPALPEASLPAALRDAAGPGPVLVVPWRTDCAPCQQLLVTARQAAALRAAADPTQPPATVLALAVQADAAAARDWLSRGGIDVVAVDDPQARLAGALGLPALPWIGAWGADGLRRGAWAEPPSAETLVVALQAP